MAQNYQQAMVNKLSGDPFEQFKQNNPAPGMDTPYNPQSGSYASFLDARAQRPDVQAWQKQAQDAFSQSMANQTFDGKGIIAGAPAGPEITDGKVTPAAPALDFGRLAGYDQGKFDANKQDAKYQIGRTLAAFDPRQGITPDVVNALNGLGYGTFSGSGDKLNLSGLTDKGRQNNLTGDYTGADFIQGFKSGNGKWGYADPVAEAAQAAPQGTASIRPNVGALAPALQGDAQANIQQALGQLGQSQDSSLIQQLIAKLQGGQ